MPRRIFHTNRFAENGDKLMSSTITIDGPCVFDVSILLHSDDPRALLEKEETMAHASRLRADVASREGWPVAA